MKGFGPPERSASPSYGGTGAFLHLPYETHLTNVDVAVVGLPFDAGSTDRSSARFGPRAIREGSFTLRPHYNPAQRVAVFERLSVVDYGDAPVVPASVERSLVAMQETLATVHAAGAVPLGLGGDHAVLLAGLRAAAGRHGPLALVLFDAHDDAHDDDFGEAYGQGTPVRRALEEGLIDAERSIVMGLRGGLRDAGEYERLRELGFTVAPWEELAQLGTGIVAAAVDRAAGKAFLSFGIDFVDPAFAPGTGTPECGGPSSTQALALLRACRGLDLAGADVVEVAPDLDVAHLTATLAATVAWEILTLIACERPAPAGDSGGPDPGGAS